MKAIWTGSIGFGLVNIPVKLFSAIQSSELDLDMLDRHDLSNIKFKRVNEKTGKEVLWEDIVRGYKLEESYVVLTDQDFEDASPEKTKIIEIAEFVDEKELDSMFYETPYYLAPEKSGLKAYALLHDAMIQAKRVGLGSFVLRSKQSLCFVKPIQGVLVLQNIRYAEEIRLPAELEIKPIVSKPAEIKMAVELIQQRSGPLDISTYKNTYAEQLLTLIKAKAKGRKSTSSAIKVVHKATGDLMAQLKASLQKKA